MTTLGQRVGDALEEQKVSAAELARRVNLSRSAVSQIINGETKAPKPENLFAIADALGYEARWLATGKGPRRKSDTDQDILDLSGLSSESKSQIRKIVSTFSQPAEDPGTTTDEPSKRFA